MRCPFATWRGPIPNMTEGHVLRPARGVVFHIMGASMAAADAWFHNPNAQASAHFGIGQDGRLVQWVDTADKAWHAKAANTEWIGVETDGSSGPLSASGVATFAKLYRWLHDAEHVPYGVTDDVNGHGFGWHGMGGAAWGGHPYCPGGARKAQRAHILELAQGSSPTAPQPTQEDDLLILVTHDPASTDPNYDNRYLFSGGVKVWLTDGATVGSLIAAGVKEVRMSWEEASRIPGPE